MQQERSKSQFHSRSGGQSGIERRPGLSQDTFRRKYVNSRRPVILTDAIASWKALSRWTPEFFRSEFGDRKVPIDEGFVAMRDFIEGVEQSSEREPGPYLMGTGTGRYLGDLFPELLADIEPRPDYLQPNWLEDHFYPPYVAEILNRGAMAEIFFGGCGARFPVLHWDYLAYHAFAFQIYGAKQWTLYAPSDSGNLYPKLEMPNQSRVENFEDPDLDRFPRLAAARAIQFELHAGEMLFVPWGWWHTTHLPGPSISVSINSANASNWWPVVYYLARSLGGVRSGLLAAASLAAHRLIRAIR